MFKRWGIFRGLLISYVVITLIPVGVFLSVTVNSFSENYRANIIQSRVFNLRRVSQTLDERIRECKNLSIQFSNNRDISKYQLSTPYSGNLAIRELAQMKETNEFLSDIGVYYYGGDYLYSSSGATELHLALTKYYNISVEEAEEVARLIMESRQPVLTAARNYSRVFFIVPLPVNYPDSYGAALFLFEQNAMSQLFSAEPGDMRFWAQDDGTILYASHPDAELGDGLSDGTELWIGDAKYHVLSADSQSVNGLNVVLLLDDHMLTPVFDGVLPSTFALIGVIILCLALATWFSSRYWQPIRELGALLREDSGRDMHWEPIQSAVRRTLTQNEALANRLEDHMNVLRENLALRLIQGELEDENELSQSMHDLGFETGLTHGCILAVRMDSHMPDAPLQVIELMRTEYARSSCAVEVGKVDSVVIVCFLPGNNTDTDAARRIAEGIAALTEDTIAVGVGRVMPVTRLRWSYLQAMAILNRDCGGRPGVATIDDAVMNARLMPELNEKEMIMALAIKQGNAPLARQMISEMVDYSLNHAPSIYSYTCHCLLNRVMQIHSDTAELAQSVNLDAAWHALSQLIDGSMPEEFKLQLMDAAEALCREVARIDEKREGEYARAVAEYVRANCLDKAFSLDMLADEFGSSTAYWSRFFKDKLGCNFSEYVWTFRLNKAKQLLEETDLPIKDIVDKVGYIDTRSFIRKFKNSEGITPGQYKARKVS